MMVGLQNWFSGRIKYFSLFGLAGLLGLTLALQRYSQNSSNIVSLQDGVQTCFLRIHNSFTARLISKGEGFLSSSFTDTTEECLGEVISAFESLKIDRSSILENLNTLSIEINEFHEKVTAVADEETGLFIGNTEDVLIANVENRFEKLELLKEEVLSELSLVTNIISSKKKILNLLFFIFAAIAPVFIFLDYLFRNSKEDEVSFIENQARALTLKENISESEVNKFIIDSFEKLNLLSLKNLYEKIIPHQTENISEGEVSSLEKKKTEEDEVGSPILIGSHSSLSNEVLDDAWKKTESIRPQKKRPTVELESVVGNVVELVSSKIFTQGIQLDINMGPVKVYGESEVLEQAFYQLLTNSINNYDFDDPKKYLSINLQQLGVTTFIDFFDSGIEFSKEFLRASRGLPTESAFDTELTIAQELVKDMGGKISFENVSNKKGEVIGRKIQVVLEGVRKAEEKKSSKRVHVEKTTKRDFLKSLKNPEIS